MCKVCAEVPREWVPKRGKAGQSDTSVVFGSPVSGPEKDWDWTGLGPIGLQIPRTTKDRNRSLVLGLLHFWKSSD